MKTVTATLLLFLIALSTESIADESAIAAGKEKSATCVACHGENGISTMPVVPGMIVPNIAGQYADYLIKALTDYRSGARQNASMNGMVAGLSDDDIRDLAAYYASLEGLKVVKKP